MPLRLPNVNRRVARSFTLDILATDDGDPPRSAALRVRIQLRNVIEPPTFLSGTLARVAEVRSDEAMECGGMRKRCVPPKSSRDLPKLTLFALDRRRMPLSAAPFLNRAVMVGISFVFPRPT